MGEADKFVPTDIIQHRYQDPQVLIKYLKGLFKDDPIVVKNLGDGRLGMKLPRKLKKHELDEALQAFNEAESDRQMDDGD